MTDQTKDSTDDLKTRFTTLQELVQEAQAKLPPEAWNYLVGGSETETTLRRNRLALDTRALVPSVLTDVSSVSIETKFLGSALRIPVILAPVGSTQLFDPEGGAAIARAAAEFGTFQVVSSVTEPDFETIAGASSADKMFQLYIMGDEDWMAHRVERAIAAGYRGFCLTADTQVLSRRERDWLKRWSIPSGSVSGNFGYQAQMNWGWIERFKRRFEIPLAIKGIVTAADAKRACDLGVDVVWVSNHGGRQLDHGPSTLDRLPQVAEAVAGQAEIVFDGGVLRGTDVVKALALGADVVACGRLYCLGLAAAGQGGIVRTLEILEHEIQIATALCGLASIEDLNPSMVELCQYAPPNSESQSPTQAGSISHLTSAFPHWDF